MRAGRWLVLGLLGCLAAAAPARAEWVELHPGPEGEDVAPYSFFPTLLRGSHPTLWAFTDFEDGQEHSFVTYLRFELPPGLLADGGTVAEALLTLVYALDDVGWGGSSSAPGVLECRPVTEAWSEGSVTWNARPGFGDPVAVSDGITGLGVLELDVTGLVADWASGARPNHGFALTNPTDRMIGFHSFEASVDPIFKASLAIEVVPEPTAGSGALAALAALGAARRCRGAA